MLKSLVAHIQKYVDLKESDVVIMQNYFEQQTFKNKDYLLQAGQICKSYCFVKKGCLRMFYYNEKGTEQITHFAIENWWLTDYYSFLNQQSSAFCIQAIEPSEILTLNYTLYNQLLKEVPILERYFRIMAQLSLAASQVRLKLIFELSKEDMYLHFSSSFPNFAQRVPQYMLASFLGLTPEYLSEIRKKNAHL